MGNLASDADAETPTQAMCKAWRLFKVHGRDAVSLVDHEVARCLRSGDRDGAAEWRQVAEALGEWCS